MRLFAQLAALARRRLNPFFARPVRALVVDVDGTLTDGGMYYGPQGEALKKFNTRDAKGMLDVQALGIRICIITAEDSPSVAARMRKLGFTEYHAGVKDKLPLLKKLAADWNTPLAEIAYIGDDLGDLECLQAAGVACCPADAVPEVLAASRYICTHKSGAGAVREVCDLIRAARR